MKRIIISFAFVLTAICLRAGTPAQEIVNDYKDLKGARYYLAKGAVMKVARPLMKSYSIAPLSHKVEEMSVLRVDKMKQDLQESFLIDLEKVLETYVYAGKSDSPHGVVDAYVHIASPDVADELVVYNPELMALYSLIGEFTKEELLKIQQPVE